MPGVLLLRGGVVGEVVNVLRHRRQKDLVVLRQRDVVIVILHKRAAQRIHHVARAFDVCGVCGRESVITMCAPIPI